MTIRTTILTMTMALAGAAVIVMGAEVEEVGSVRHGLSIDSVDLATDRGARQEWTIHFTVKQPASIKIDFYGPNEEIITEVHDRRNFPEGTSAAVWACRDNDGEAVPDEAYWFTVAAQFEDGRSELWDPLLTSGGERVVAGDLKVVDQNRLTYQLPKPSRVLIRAAVEEGPLVRTIVNWEPRPAGLCLEQWDGMDASGTRRLADIPNVRIGVMAFALPENSIITTGNKTITYREYYEKKGKLRPHKPKVVREVDDRTVISPHWLMPVHLNRDPVLSMKFLGIDAIVPTGSMPTASAPITVDVQPASQPSNRVNWPPIASSRPAIASRPAPSATKLTGSQAVVRVDIPNPDERMFMNNQKFELIVYVDDKRILEIEQGHVPFNYPLDLSLLSPGRHLLTINVSSFRNHLGTVSRYVEVVR